MFFYPSIEATEAVLLLNMILFFSEDGQTFLSISSEDGSISSPPSNSDWVSLDEATDDDPIIISGMRMKCDECPERRNFLVFFWITHLNSKYMGYASDHETQIFVNQIALFVLTCLER